VILEATGGLETPVASALATSGIAVAVVNPRQVRDFARAAWRRSSMTICSNTAAWQPTWDFMRSSAWQLGPTLSSNCGACASRYRRRSRVRFFCRAVGIGRGARRLHVPFFAQPYRDRVASLAAASRTKPGDSSCPRRTVGFTRTVARRSRYRSIRRFALVILVQGKKKGQTAVSRLGIYCRGVGYAIISTENRVRSGPLAGAR
jgi:hypothetical protein